MPANTEGPVVSSDNVLIFNYYAFPSFKRRPEGKKKNIIPVLTWRASHEEHNQPAVSRTLHQFLLFNQTRFPLFIDRKPLSGPRSYMWLLSRLANLILPPFSVSPTSLLFSSKNASRLWFSLFYWTLWMTQ